MPDPTFWQEEAERLTQRVADLEAVITWAKRWSLVMMAMDQAGGTAFLEGPLFDQANALREEEIRLREIKEKLLGEVKNYGGSRDR